MHATLSAAGLVLTNAEADVRRYCGLTGEVWAYRYFDAISTTPNEVTAVDVVSTAALHPSLAQSDLTWFVNRAGDVRAWLDEVNPDISLVDADAGLVAHVVDGLETLAEGDGVGLSLLTKVVHRKRPRLVPLFDRRVWRPYVRASGVTNAEAWPTLIAGMRHDLAAPENLPALELLQAGLATDLEGQVVPTRLRILDIALWMEEGAS